MLGPYINKGLEFKPMNIAVGKAALFLVGLGFTDALSGLIAGMLGKVEGTQDYTDYGSYANIGLGVALPKIQALSDIFGVNGTELLSVAAISNGLNGLLEIETKVRDVVAGLKGDTPKSGVRRLSAPQRSSYQLPAPAPSFRPAIPASASASAPAPVLSRPVSQPENRMLSRLNPSMPMMSNDIGQTLEALMAS